MPGTMPNIPSTAPDLSNSIDKIIQVSRKYEIPETIDEKIPLKIITKKVKLKQKKIVTVVNEDTRNY